MASGDTLQAVVVRGRVLAPVRISFLSHEFDELRVAGIELELVADVHPLHLPRIISGLQGELVHGVPWVPKKQHQKKGNLFILLFLNVILYSQSKIKNKIKSLLLCSQRIKNLNIPKFLNFN